MLDRDYTEDNVRTSLVKESREELARALNKTKHDADLRDGVVGTTYSRMRSEPHCSVRYKIFHTGVAADAACGTRCGEADDHIAQELDVRLKSSLLLGRERLARRVELDPAYDAIRLARSANARILTSCSRKAGRGKVQRFGTWRSWWMEDGRWWV